MIHYQDDTITLHHGDCVAVLRTLADNSIDAIVTDPPYGLEFMGKEWDGSDGFRRSLNANDAGRDNAFGRTSRTSPEYRAGHLFQLWCQEWATECLRVLKPGGHLLAFGGTRTWHRLAVAVEDAGFEIRDSIAWLYGSGFSKSWNFRTQFPSDKWCTCGNPVPLNHASDPDLQSLRESIPPPTLARSEGEGASLFTTMQWREQGQGMGEARPQGPGSLDGGVGSVLPGEDDRAVESSVAGRLIHRAGQGLSDGTETGASASTGERVRRGAPAGDGDDDRSAGKDARRSASHKRPPGGQPTGESETVPGPYESLDDRALRHSASCARCGGLNEAYKGYGTGLKPAHEPIIVARKPLIGTVAANVLAHGTGAINVDGCRIHGDDVPAGRTRHGGGIVGAGSSYELPDSKGEQPAGRWPANVALDADMADVLDAQTMDTRAGKPSATGSLGATSLNLYGGTRGRGGQKADAYTDTGGASRFFFVSRKDNECPTPDHASTAAETSCQPSEPADSARSDAAISAHLDTAKPTLSATTNGRASESRHRNANDTQQTTHTGREFSSGSQHERHTPTHSRANNAEPTVQIDTTTTTADRSTFDGSADHATYSTTSPSWVPGVADSGERFRFVAKAPTTERPNVDGEAHATVKPLDLMRWLIRLITPPGGVVLDPFAGSGTTLEAAGIEGFRAVGIEREADYLPLIVQRIQRTPLALFDDGEAS